MRGDRLAYPTAARPAREFFSPTFTDRRDRHAASGPDCRSGTAAPLFTSPAANRRGFFFAEKNYEADAPLIELLRSLYLRWTTFR